MIKPHWFEKLSYEPNSLIWHKYSLSLLTKKKIQDCFWRDRKKQLFACADLKNLDSSCWACAKFAVLQLLQANCPCTHSYRAENKRFASTPNLETEINPFIQWYNTSNCFWSDWKPFLAPSREEHEIHRVFLLMVDYIQTFNYRFFSG